MKIQQHDGVVVEATVISAGLRQALGDGGVSREGEGEARGLGAQSSLPLLHLFLLPQLLGEALPESCCIYHHAVVLLDLHQPLLPPCWIKLEETSSQPYVC